MSKLTAFLKRIEVSISTNLFSRHTFFLLCTLLTISIMGYHFGTFDQASHIPFLRQMSDPFLYPGDQLVPLWRLKYSYFWQLFIPLLRINLLEPTLFTVYVVSIYFTFFMLWRLAMILFASTRTAIFFTALMAFPHLGFGFINIFEFSLVNRVVIFPFALLSISYYLQKRYLFAFLILGFMFNLHALTVIFTLILFGTDILFRWRKIGIRKILQSGIIFVVAASPVLAWKAQTTGFSFASNAPWFRDLAYGVLAHLYSLTSIQPPLLIASMIGVIQFMLTSRYISMSGDGHVHRVMRNFLTAILVAMILNTLSTIFYPSVFIIQFQLLRISIFLTVFFYAYASAHLFDSADPPDRNTSSFITRSALLFTSITIFFFAFGEFLNIQKKRFSLGILLLILQICTSALLISYLYRQGVFMPGVYVYARTTASVDAQRWVSQNTPKEAMILAPPYLWSMYEVDWRVFSKRPMVVSWSELLEIAFLPDKYPDWVRRFDDVVPGARNEFNGFFIDNLARIKEIYVNLDKENVEYLTDKYGVSYFVTDKTVRYPFPVVYENTVFRIYTMVRKDLVID